MDVRRLLHTLRRAHGCMPVLIIVQVAGEGGPSIQPSPHPPKGRGEWCRSLVVNVDYLAEFGVTQTLTSMVPVRSAPP